MTSEEILRKIEDNREIIRGFGVRRLGIFGSYARGEESEAGDMDFLVEFEHDVKTQDAVIRNFEVIGEAANRLPEEIGSLYHDIERAKIVGFRNILIHLYFGVKLDTVWSAIEEKPCDLEEQTKAVLDE